MSTPEDSLPLSLSRDSLRERYHAVRAFTGELAAPLSPEDQTIQSMADASPAKWHRAHTTWFFETFILKPFGHGRTSYRPEYEYMFNSYYQGVGPQFHRPSRGVLSRPGADEVGEYRAHVDAAMADYFDNAKDNQWRSSAALIQLGLNHEQQHQELLLTDIKHAMSFNPLDPKVYDGAPATGDGGIRPIEWIPFEGGVHPIGWDADGFAFDNEGPAHEVLLQPFRLADRLVTNGEYMEFIEAGGYAEPRHWHADGWTTVETQHWDAPIYWREVDGQWHEYTLRGLVPVDADSPVTHVSFYEAAAYAEWRGCRLPTEAEWEVAAAGLAMDGNFVEDGHYHPRPLAKGGSGLKQMFGDVWEWTSSAYLPYPGFKPAQGAVGEYNGKFMVNQMVLRGGSCATAADHIRRTYRNFFYADARWQFSGIRLAQDL